MYLYKFKVIVYYWVTLFCNCQKMFRRMSKLFGNRRSTSKPVDGDTCHNDSGYSIWSPGNNDACKQFVRTHGTSEVTSVAAAESMMCLSGAKNGKLALCRHTTGDVIQKWSGHEKEITRVACGGQNCKLYASASRDKTVCVWRCSGYSTEATQQHRYSGHDLAVTGITLSPCGSQMLSGSRDNTVRLWDVADGQCIRVMSLAQNLVTHVCWGRASGSSLVAQSSEDKTVRLWDTRFLHVASATAPKQHIQTCCDLSGADDRFCLSASNGFGGNGCEATLWDLRSCARPLREFTGHFETVNGCCFILSPTRFMAATCSNDGTIRLWDCNTGVNLATLSIPASGPLTGIAVADDSSLYVSSFFAGIQVVSIIQNVTGTIGLQRTATFWCDFLLKYSIYSWVVNICNSFPNYVMEAVSIDTFKNRLYKSSNNFDNGPHFWLIITPCCKWIYQILTPWTHVSQPPIWHLSRFTRLFTAHWHYWIAYLSPLAAANLSDLDPI